MKLRSKTTAQPKAASSTVAERMERNQTSEPKKKKARTTQPSKDDTQEQEEEVKTGNSTNISGGAVCSPEEWINAITKDINRRQEIQGLHNLIRLHAPSLEPTLEFKDKLGYGKYHYKYKSGRQGDWVKIGISLNEKSNNNSISLHFCGLANGKYILEGYTKQRLAKPPGRSNKGIISIGKSCLRFQSVQDLNEAALIALIKDTETADIMT